MIVVLLAACLQRPASQYKIRLDDAASAASLSSGYRAAL